MKILGIESSCDETAAAVVENGREIKSNIVASSLEKHKFYGGVVPEIASRCHAEAISTVVEEAMKEANCCINEIDAVAVTYAPGLIGALLVGVNYAKGLAYASDKALVPVHHLRSHIASNYLSSDLKPPFLCLVVSGGHSHIVAVNGYTDYKIIGKTRDDAAGEALDKAGRAMGLEYPGGISIDRISRKGNADAFEFPHPKVNGSIYDFSFSGLKTAVLNIIHNFEQREKQINTADLAASFQKSVVGCLTKNFEAAAKNLGYNKLVLAGGVAANSLLRDEMSLICKKHHWDLVMPEIKYCGDNGAMVAAQGYYEYISGVRAPLNLNAYATMAIDSVKF